MSDLTIDLGDSPKKQTTPDSPPITITKVPGLTLADARQYAKALTDKVLAFAGKPGYNPYLWMQQSGLDKLNKELAACENDDNQELFAKVFAIQYETPSLENLS